MAARRPWQIALVVLCAAWWLQKLVWSNPGNQWDFRVYYYSTQAWRAGLDPYDTASLPDDLRAEGLRFSYPPYALALFAPITRLPIERAQQLYLALKLFALVWLIRIWSRLLRTEVTDPVWVLFLVFAYSSAIYVDFASGSTTTFEQCLLWFGIAALLERRLWTFVTAVVGASLLRLAPIPLLLLCLGTPDRRRLHYVAVGIAAFVGILLLTDLMSPRLTAEFARSIANNVGERGRINPSLLPLVLDTAAVVKRSYHVSLTPAIRAAIYLAFAAAFVIPTAIVVRRVTKSEAFTRVDVLYLVILAYALVMPRFKNYHYMLLVAPTYYIATHSTRLRRSIPLLLLASLPIYSWITREDNITLLANYSQWLIALGAWALCLFEIQRGDLLASEG